jgi:hypothetical protein
MTFPDFRHVPVTQFYAGILLWEPSRITFPDFRHVPGTHFYAGICDENLPGSRSQITMTLVRFGRLFAPVLKIIVRKTDFVFETRDFVMVSFSTV